MDPTHARKRADSRGSSAGKESRVKSVFVWYYSFFFPLILNSPQAALNKYAAQTSRAAATDIVFSTRHNNWADKNAALQVDAGTVGGGTSATIQYVFLGFGMGSRGHGKGQGSSPSVLWNPAYVFASLFFVHPLRSGSLRASALALNVKVPKQVKWI